MSNLIITALKYYGTNPQNWTFPWCAAFLNAILNETNHTPTGSNMARSFLDVGKKATSPKIGDIVIFWRVLPETPWGHCGLYILEDESSITVLGGNQDGTVKIKSYPKWRLLDIRTLDD